jgi:methionine-rich copper-binding protein CopC
MKRNLVLFVFAALPALLFSASLAHAHALLDHASPLVGSTVRSAPRTISLWFTQKLESAFSTIEVRDTRGTRVDAGKARVGGDGTMLQTALKALPPGTYQVHWRVLSVDTHTTEGNFSFSVGQ